MNTVLLIVLLKNKKRFPFSQIRIIYNIPFNTLLWFVGSTIDSRDIVDGHREKTLSLLWKIIFAFHVRISFLTVLFLFCD